MSAEPEFQRVANGVLLALLMLLPFALGTMLSGRSRGSRRVLGWARGLALATVVLAIGYDVAGAVCLILAEPTPGHEPWVDPAAVVHYPTFFLPIGVAAFLAALGTLVATIRARHHLG
ncbi:hypothetical protein JOF29_001853 [Kribbella aluminosa]|uniref:Uncharacterized protein n=1 Tax=Kribbella aluminosa TaxID=416017 RepID=A0ABS4UGM9_9ACTN|nr:hypothetical protein [Kribbella aluminosa]MBP2350770.1 hypothetical protein [Kribbella aluminosa]